MKIWKLVPAVLGFIAAMACLACSNGEGVATGDTDTDTDADSDSNSDSYGNGDSDSDTDTSTEIGPIEMDCSDCPAVGSTLENMLCAIDMCDPDVIVANEYFHQWLGDCSTEGTYTAVNRTGTDTNGLAPKKMIRMLSWLRARRMLRTMTGQFAQGTAWIR